jgi:hypothetical protein
MQPILAESAPHRGRALVFAVVLAAFAFAAIAPSLAPAPLPQTRSYHRLPGTGKCPHAKHVKHVKPVNVVHAYQ